MSGHVQFVRKSTFLRKGRLTALDVWNLQYIYSTIIDRDRPERTGLSKSIDQPEYRITMGSMELKHNAEKRKLITMAAVS